MNKKYAALIFVGYLEATSYLLLLCVAMPLKYLADWDLAVKYTGWAHGVLFVLYMMLLLMEGIRFNWAFKIYIYGFLAAIFPFGPIIFDRKILKNL